jgi:N-acetylneuraminic acid mutarotase
MDKKTDMPDAMVFLPKSAPVINGKVYIMGGLNNLVSSEMQIYDLKTDTWTKGPDMPTARYSSAAVAYKDKILVFGGCTGADFANNQLPTTKVEEYDVYGGNPPKAVSAKGKSASLWGSIKAR